MTQQQSRLHKGGAPEHLLKVEARRYWERAKAAAPAEDVSAKAIYATLSDAFPEMRRRAEKNGRSLTKPSRRAVQVWVQSWNKGGSDVPPRLQWRPWTEDANDADTAAHLLRLDFVSRMTYRRGLYEDEARWAGRIRCAVADLDLFVALFLAREYALEDFWATQGQKNPDTRNLDALLGAKPWRPEYRELFWGNVFAVDSASAGTLALGEAVFALGLASAGTRALVAVEIVPNRTATVPDIRIVFRFRQNYEPNAFDSPLMRWVEWSLFPWRKQDFPRQITWRDIAQAAWTINDPRFGPWDLSKLIFEQRASERSDTIGKA